jgi:thiol:disulfide interchange protein DsbA
MNLTRRAFSMRTLLAPTACALGALGGAGLHAQPSPGPASESYRRLSPGQQFGSPGGREVTEFFSYACPHCFDLESVLADWTRHLAPSVAFVRVPVPFLMSADVLMRSYYAFTAMGVEPVMTPVVFSAIHSRKVRIESLEDVAVLVKGAGGDPARFLALSKSFGMTTKVERAREVVKSAGIDSTPTLVVNGRYVTSPALAGGHPQALAVVDALLGMSQARA